MKTVLVVRLPRSKWVISRVISTLNGVTLIITLLTKSPGPPSIVFLRSSIRILESLLGSWLGGIYLGRANRFLHSDFAQLYGYPICYMVTWRLGQAFRLSLSGIKMFLPRITGGPQLLNVVYLKQK